MKKPINKIPVNKSREVIALAKELFKMSPPAYKRSFSGYLADINSVMADYDLYARKNKDNKTPSDALLEFRHNLYTMRRITRVFGHVANMYKCLSPEKCVKVRAKFQRVMDFLYNVHTYVFITAYREIGYAAEDLQNG